MEEEYCSQCGEGCLEFREGYCVDCCEQNQRELDLHNASYDRWNAMTTAEREDAIRRAL